LSPAAAAPAAAGSEEHRARAEAVPGRSVVAAATRLARHLAATLLAIYPAAAPDAAPRKPARRRAPARRRGKR
ncbi:MAG: hypothetical protein KIT36_23095, partial [Alphaproteobacteria bacterium]|nr:hypothetical protein [Alphaproteobacteria bacterium]